MQEKPEAQEEVTPNTDASSAPAEEKKPAKKRAKKEKESKPFKAGFHGTMTLGELRELVKLPEEGSPLYRAKQELTVPEGLSGHLRDNGWDAATPLAVIEDGQIYNGRTKWRAVQKFEDSFEIPVEVSGMDEIEASSLSGALDYRVQKLDALTTAKQVFYDLSAGKTEKEIFEATGIHPEQQNGYLLLYEFTQDKAKCPAGFEDAIREGKVSFTAALELVRQSEKVSKSELGSMISQIEKATAGGVRVSANDVKKASGTNDGPATQKQKKQLILDLQSGAYDFGNGKAAEAAKLCLILALEVGLGTRTIKDMLSAAKKAAQGQAVKIDYKQYQTEKSADKK